MTILEFVARTFSPKTLDGRFIFRPWGASGPCYLLSPQQRSVRAWIQLAFYILALATFWFLPEIVATTSGLVIFFVAFVLINYILFWLFSVGLPKTEKPPAPTAEQRHTLMAAHSRALGRPLLWVFAIVAWLFAITGGAMALILQQWLSGLFVLVFFGACAATFTWQLWLIRRARNA